MCIVHIANLRLAGDRSGEGFSCSEASTSDRKLLSKSLVVTSSVGVSSSPKAWAFGSSLPIQTMFKHETSGDPSNGLSGLEDGTGDGLFESTVATAATVPMGNSPRRCNAGKVPFAEGGKTHGAKTWLRAGPCLGPQRGSGDESSLGASGAWIGSGMRLLRVGSSCWNGTSGASKLMDHGRVKGGGGGARLGGSPKEREERRTAGEGRPVSTKHARAHIYDLRRA